MSCVGLQPGVNGMEPAFGEAYGGHRALLSPYPLATSPHRGRTEYDQVRGAGALAPPPSCCFLLPLLIKAAGGSKGW